MVRILVTGFEPFGEHTENISKQVANALPSQLLIDDPWSALREHTKQSLEVILETRVLTVDEVGSLEIATAIRDGEKWDAILHLGLCESCEIPRIETLAQDCLDMRMPDNSGRQVSHQPITGLGDIAVTVSPDAWMSMPWSIDCELSQDAGTYICNETLHQTLHALNESSFTDKNTPPCLFVHLPVVENCSFTNALRFVQEVLQRMMFRPVLSVVGALITRNEHFLVAKRSSSESHPGKWEFPGGKVEPNETQPSALEREMHEEFGWSVTCSEAIGTWHHSLEKLDIALHILPTDFIGPTPDLEDKALWTAHDAISWRTLSDESDLDWLGNDSAIVQWMKETNFLPRAK